MQISVAAESAGYRSVFDPNQALADERHYNSLVQAHGSMMAIAFLIVLPTGAIIARLISHQRRIFQFHPYIQSTGFCLVLAALGCILAAVYKYREGTKEVTLTTHSKFGVFVISALFLQIIFAVLMLATYEPARGNQQPLRSRITSALHRTWGYVVLICGFTQVNLGIKNYVEWIKGKQAALIVYYVWVSILAAIFVFGTLFKYWRDRRTKIHIQEQGRLAGELKNEEDPHQQQQLPPQLASANAAAGSDEGRLQWQQLPPQPTSATAAGSDKDPRQQQQLPP